VAAPAASPSPDLSSLRSQMQRPVTVNEEKGSGGGGFFGWLKRLFGIT
jgi:hypothetical protein